MDIVDIYQTDALAKRSGEGIENVDGCNEPLVIAASPIKLIGLKYGQNGSWRIACFQLFKDIVVLKIFLGLFLV